jgi:hypothetical protein
MNMLEIMNAPLMLQLDYNDPELTHFETTVEGEQEITKLIQEYQSEQDELLTIIAKFLQEESSYLENCSGKQEECNTKVSRGQKRKLSNLDAETNSSKRQKIIA